MMFSIETLKIIVSLIGIAGFIGGIAKWLFTRFEKSILGHLEKLEEQFSEQADKHHAMDSRVTSLEEQVKNLPNARMLEEVNGEIKRLNAVTEGVSEQLKALSKSTDRMQDYLMNKDK